MKYKILVIDDEPENLMTTSSLLEQWGYAVDTAPDAKNGISQAITGEYAVILLDYRMPGKNGDEAAREIQRFNKESIILIYSCDDTRDALKKSFKAGAVD